MRRHDDEIESAFFGEPNDLLRRIARGQNSRALSERKLRLEERTEFVPSEVLLFFSNLGKWPYIELECVVTVKVEDVNQ